MIQRIQSPGTGCGKETIRGVHVPPSLPHTPGTFTMSRKVQFPTARVFQPLLQPHRYKGAFGGRGSGKSHFFAGLGVETAILKPGTRGVCIREVQKSLKESAKRLIEVKLEEHSLGPEFDVRASEIRTPGGGVIIFQGMQDHTAESIKSLEGFDWAWVEEPAR